MPSLALLISRVSVCLSHLSIYLSIYLSVSSVVSNQLSIYLSMHPFIYHLFISYLSVIYPSSINVSSSLTPDFELTQAWCYVFCRVTLFVTQPSTLGEQKDVPLALRRALALPQAPWHARW